MNLSIVDLNGYENFRDKTIQLIRNLAVPTAQAISIELSFLAWHHRLLSGIAGLDLSQVPPVQVDVPFQIDDLAAFTKGGTPNNTNRRLITEGELLPYLSTFTRRSIATGTAISTINFDQTFDLTVYSTLQLDRNLTIIATKINGLPGATNTFRIVGSGTHTVTFVGCQRVNTSDDFDVRVGALNLIQTYYDGVDVWISISTVAPTPAPVPTPAPAPISAQSTGSNLWQLTTMTKAANIDSFTATLVDWSSSAILTNKSLAGDGNIVVRLNGPDNMVGFRTNTTSTDFSGVAQSIWINSGQYFQNELGIIATTSVDANPAHFVKLTRTGTTVTAAFSPDNVTYTNIHTFASSSTGAIFAALNSYTTTDPIDVISLTGFV